MPFQKGPCGDGEGGRMRGFLLPLLEEVVVVVVLVLFFLLIFVCSGGRRSQSLGSVRHLCRCLQMRWHW